MQKQSPTKARIKRRPKLDGSSIALIINYIEQTKKSSPENGITWGQLEKRFNYSRQALEKHVPIKLAYRSANTAAVTRQNAPSVNADGAIEPISVAILKKRNSKLQEENRKLKQQNSELLEFVAQLTRKMQEKGFSLGGMTDILPLEHHHPVFQMTPAADLKANAEH